MISNEMLVQRIKAGYSVPEDMQKLYENNLPLIRKFIKPYTSYECEDDLLQESYFGLYSAVQHFESSENVLFMTYARFWIIQSVQKYIEMYGFSVRIPTYARQKIIRYKKAIKQLEQELIREPTAEEIADLMNVSVKEVQEIQTNMRGVSSLDSPISDESSMTLSDTLQADLGLEDEAIDKIYNEHSKNELWGIVERFTTKRENYILKEIFINNRTMVSMAKEQGISLSRIRQLKETALRKLRTGKAKRELLQKFEIAEAGLYRGGLKNFNEHNFISIVEHTAMRKIDAEECYKQHLTEIEEMYRQRIS